MPRKSAFGLPVWVKREEDPCLRDNAEEAYAARVLAIDAGAARKAASRGVYKAATVFLRQMGNHRLGLPARRSAGESAYVLFVKAKEAAKKDRNR